MSKEIIIGGRIISVPKGYIQAEAEYTKDVSDIFEALSPGPAKELARTECLTKRVEFYDLYVAGKATIVPRVVKIHKSTFRKVCDWLRGAEWEK